MAVAIAAGSIVVTVMATVPFGHAGDNLIERYGRRRRSGLVAGGQ
jgi:hypothetical protein